MSEHQSKLHPAENKFHKGNGGDGKHYWLTPPELYAQLNEQYHFDFDPCPYPLPRGFDGLKCEWGKSSYVNPPFGSIMHEGKKKGATAWVRKAIQEQEKGKDVVLVYPVDKWLLMLVKAGADISNLGDVKWLATEDGSAGKGTGRHIACFYLKGKPMTDTMPELKPCPFDHDDADRLFGRPDDIDVQVAYAYAHNEETQILAQHISQMKQSAHDLADKIIQAWNTRADLAPKDAVSVPREVLYRIFEYAKQWSDSFVYSRKPGFSSDNWLLNANLCADEVCKILKPYVKGE